jgi:glyoxylase-like metal-dependent hydrolase (beta-lactamase superfamily II)
MIDTAKSDKLKAYECNLWLRNATARKVRSCTPDDVLIVALLHTPGHTPGSQCFLVGSPGRPDALVSGDMLFLGSCGRVDLPGSDPKAMFDSLHHTLGRLPDETLLYPGHLYAPQASSTLGEQKRTNPYLRVARLDDFLAFLGY